MSCAAALALSGCRGGDERPDYDPAAPADPGLVVARVDHSPLAFTMKTRRGERLDPVQTWQEDNCSLVGSGFRTATDTVLLGIQVVPDDCKPGNEPGNARHGHYRSLDDAAAIFGADAAAIFGADAAAIFGADAIHVDRTNTALGPADLFTQAYYECTNSCRHYREPVAIIELTAPADARYHNLMVYSPYGRLTTKQLMGYLKLLGTP
ncbi:hypothetical protein NRB20_14000 [Nocardia sp. RB20]|uniref:Uncharacterized protein n=1 Tax=Nocardia macrotermitis TaxID=2585198 RepID=A0A7K0D064_9NOCA|nr:hypothetical protein [Nocardia macrotermitis]